MEGIFRRSCSAELGEAMVFSNEVRELVLEVSRKQLNIAAIQGLLYYLEHPVFGVPAVIAETIATHPTLVRGNSPLAGRIAYGVVDKGIDIFDEGLRCRLQQKLCCGLHRVGFLLVRFGEGEAVIESLFRILGRFVSLVTAAQDLAARERKVTRGELAALAECMIETMLEEPLLTECLLSHVAKHCRRAERETLRLRLEATVLEGLDSEGCRTEDTGCPLLRVDGPVRFRKTARNESFDGAARALLAHVNTICH